MPGEEWLDYQSSAQNRYPCFECGYKGDMPTKIFCSPENLEMKQQGYPCRTAHYLCYYCSHHRNKYSNWTLLRDKVKIVAPTLNDFNLAKDPFNPNDKGDVKVESLTKEEYDKIFDVDPVSGKMLKTHYLYQQEVDKSRNEDLIKAHVKKNKN